MFQVSVHDIGLTCAVCCVCRHGSVVIIGSFLIAAVMEAGAAVDLLLRGRNVDAMQPLIWGVFDAAMARVIT